MKILVCIKQVPDTETKIQIESDQVKEDAIKWIMNPYDEFAVEEALQLKTKKGVDSTVTVLTAGPKSRAVDALRTGLAMGADSAIVVDSPAHLDSLGVATVLASAIEKSGPYDAIFFGKLSIDANNFAVPQMVAEKVGATHCTNAIKTEFQESSVLVSRESEGGTKETFELQFPCVVSANKGLNTPRYASLPGIMKAKKKPIEEHSLSSLGLSEDISKTKLSQYSLPPDRPDVQMIEGEASVQSAALVKKLREEAKVI